MIIEIASVELQGGGRKLENREEKTSKREKDRGADMGGGEKGCEEDQRKRRVKGEENQRLKREYNIKFSIIPEKL